MRHPEETIVVINAQQETTRPLSAAKARLLEVADELFYSEGIHTVGIDRIIATAGVTKATFYKHYGSKDNLILDYIVGRSASVRRLLLSVVDEGQTPAEVLRAMRTLAVRLCVSLSRSSVAGGLSNRTVICARCSLSGTGLTVTSDGSMSGPRQAP